jgi:uncharacterized protein YjbI with pentapeptide repeats
MNTILKSTITTTLVTLLISLGSQGQSLEQEDLARLQNTKSCANPCDLSNGDLSRVYLVEANLVGANLQGAYLNEVTLTNANLQQANLTSANLGGSYLRGANFLGANLSQSRLIRADFKETILTQANLQGAILSHAKNLSPQQIKSTCNWEEGIYHQDAVKNQEFIANLSADTPSDPEVTIDCSAWSQL